jgi:hypothetical protein
MSGPMSGRRIVDDLLVLDAVDDFDDIDFDYAVVEDLLRALAEFDDPSGAPSPVFLAELIAAVPPVATPGRRGLRIAVASGAVFLAAAGTAAAATGSLPGPLQSAVHAIAGVVGIDVPHGGTPESGGSQDGPGHGRSDEAPGRPEDPGQPADPGRSDEAPGAPLDPGSDGVGIEGAPPGQVENEHSDPIGVENPTAGGNPDPTGGSPEPTIPEGSSPDTGGNPNAGGANANASSPNAFGGNTNANPAAATGSGNADARADGHAG